MEKHFTTENHNLLQPAQIGRYTSALMYAALRDAQQRLTTYNVPAPLTLGEAVSAYESEQLCPTLNTQPRAMWETVDELLAGLMANYGPAEVRMIVNRLYANQCKLNNQSQGKNANHEL